MIKMTAQMREVLAKALDDGVPCLIGTVSKAGRPQISPKGSVAVFDEQTLCFWERSHRGVQANIMANPRVVVYFRNAMRAKELPWRGAALRFHGNAQIVDRGPQLERAWELTVPAEKEKDPKKKGVAVLIDIDLIEELSGTVVMQRE
jgi:predicted pyridoxine 5'-phosphate oxidase superfamily flavin-nucleotide-binding protein